jgi:transcriptional regulator with XRE-family HTH domain
MPKVKKVKRIRSDNPFQKIVRLYMKRHDLSTKEMSFKLNTYPSSVSRIIHGDHLPTMGSFCNILYKLKLSPAELFYFMEDMSEYYQQQNGLSDKPFRCRNQSRWIDATYPKPINHSIDIKPNKISEGSFKKDAWKNLLPSP